MPRRQDWGTTPAVIDTALTFADENDIAITIHTDSALGNRAR